MVNMLRDIWIRNRRGFARILMLSIAASLTGGISIVMLVPMLGAAGGIRKFGIGPKTFDASAARPATRRTDYGHNRRLFFADCTESIFRVVVEDSTK